MRSQPIDREVGNMGGRIPKQLIYGQNQVPETQIEIDCVREALWNL